MAPSAFSEDLATAVRLARRVTPSRPAVISIAEGAELTYAELDERSDRMAAALLGLGLVPGDRVAFWLETSLAHVVLYIAAAKARLVAVPVNERFTAGEAAFLLENSGARALVFGSFAAAAVDSLGLSGEIVLIAAGDAVDGSRSVTDVEATGRPGSVIGARDAEDPFILGYTSGTTGRPKGAVLTHRSVLSVARSNAVAYRIPMHSVGVYTASMTFTATVPAFFGTHFHVRGTVVVAPRRDPDTVIDLVERYRADYTHMPPPLVDDFAAAFARRRAAVTTLRAVMQGSGKVAAERLAPLNEALEGRLLLGWGMTESSGGLLTASTLEDMRRALRGDLDILDSVGRPVPETELEVRGPDGAPVGGEGELAARSRSIMAGYWDPATGKPVPLADGWYPTGDIGFVDADGFVHLRDRRSDLIVSGGLNVYPTEVEEVLRRLPDIADCAVVGVDDERWGQAVAACVVVRAGSGLTPEQIVEHCRAHLASFKKPTRIRFGTELPRTLSGKVKRHEVRALFTQNVWRSP